MFAAGGHVFTSHDSDRGPSISSWDTRTGKRVVSSFPCPAALEAPGWFFLSLARNTNPGVDVFPAAIYSSDATNLYATLNIFGSHTMSYWHPRWDWPRPDTVAPRDQTEAPCSQLWTDYVAWGKRWLAANPGLDLATAPAGVIESRDAGASWHLLPFPPDPDLTHVADYTPSAYVVPVAHGVAYGTPDTGWTFWDRNTGTWSSYTKQASTLGMRLSDDWELPDPGNLPKRWHIAGDRRLANGSLWTFEIDPTSNASIITWSRNSHVVARRAVRLTVPATPLLAYDCTKLVAPAIHSVREMMSSENGELWALTPGEGTVTCYEPPMPGRRNYQPGPRRVTIFFKTLLLHSKDAGRHWRVMPRAPQMPTESVFKSSGNDPFWLIAANGHAVTLAFGPCASQTGREMATWTGKSWHKLGCEPVSQNSKDDFIAW